MLLFPLLVRLRLLLFNNIWQPFAHWTMILYTQQWTRGTSRSSHEWMSERYYCCWMQLPCQSVWKRRHRRFVVLNDFHPAPIAHCRIIFNQSTDRLTTLSISTLDPCQRWEPIDSNNRKKSKQMVVSGGWRWMLETKSESRNGVRLSEL